MQATDKTSPGAIEHSKPTAALWRVRDSPLGCRVTSSRHLSPRYCYSPLPWEFSCLLSLWMVAPCLWKFSCEGLAPCLQFCQSKLIVCYCSLVVISLSLTSSEILDSLQVSPGWRQMGNQQERCSIYKINRNQGAGVRKLRAAIQIKVMIPCPVFRHVQFSDLGPTEWSGGRVLRRMDPTTRWQVYNHCQSPSLKESVYIYLNNCSMGKGDNSDIWRTVGYRF